MKTTSGAAQLVTMFDALHVVPVGQPHSPCIWNAGSVNVPGPLSGVSKLQQPGVYVKKSFAVNHSVTLGVYMIAGRAQPHDTQHDKRNTALFPARGWQQPDANN